jgi:HD superfamily phosphohydrolase
MISGMQRFSPQFYDDAIIIPSSLGGVIDFDLHDPFENMLRKVIAAPEYQRMYDIPQLGFVGHEIPSAHHSRLEHCIGAFDLMRSLIYFSNRNYKKPRVEALRFNEAEQAAQAAALLHDLGHAFPGHPFERCVKKLFPDSYQNHEKWSIEIIRRSDILSILDSYRPGFAGKVLEVMKEDNLANNIWQQIHCGNLNVDTLDYLMRDQLHTTGGDRLLARRIIENVKFCQNSDGSRRLDLLANADLDFTKMLCIRGHMYSEVYFNGFPAAAEAFLGMLFQKTNDALKGPARAAIKGINSPYIDFIDSKGTDYKSYLGLTNQKFYRTTRCLAQLDLGEVSEIAKNYDWLNVYKSFDATDFYKGNADGAPTESKIKEAREKTEHDGGIFSDKIISLYDTGKPEVYCLNGTRKFSDLCPDVANKKIRIISKFHMKRLQYAI